MLEFLKNQKIHVCLLVLLSLRSLFMFDFAQAIALICVTSVYLFQLFLDDKKETLQRQEELSKINLHVEFKEEIEKMKNQISNLGVKTTVKSEVPNKRFF